MCFYNFLSSVFLFSNLFFSEGKDAAEQLDRMLAAINSIPAYAQRISVMMVLAPGKNTYKKQFKIINLLFLCNQNYHFVFIFMFVVDFVF